MLKESRQYPINPDGTPETAELVNDSGEDSRFRKTGCGNGTCHRAKEDTKLHGPPLIGISLTAIPSHQRLLTHLKIILREITGGCRLVYRRPCWYCRLIISQLSKHGNRVQRAACNSAWNGSVARAQLNTGITFPITDSSAEIHL